MTMLDLYGPHWILSSLAIVVPSVPLIATMTTTYPLLIHFGLSVTLVMAISIQSGPIWSHGGHGVSSVGLRGTPVAMWILGASGNIKGILIYIHNLSSVSAND